MTTSNYPFSIFTLVLLASHGNDRSVDGFQCTYVISVFSRLSSTVASFPHMRDVLNKHCVW